MIWQENRRKNSFLLLVDVVGPLSSLLFSTDFLSALQQSWESLGVKRHGGRRAHVKVFSLSPALTLPFHHRRMTSRKIPASSIRTVFNSLMCVSTRNDMWNLFDFSHIIQHMIERERDSTAWCIRRKKRHWKTLVRWHRGNVNILSQIVHSQYALYWMKITCSLSLTLVEWLFTIYNLHAIRDSSGAHIEDEFVGFPFLFFTYVAWAGWSEGWKVCVLYGKRERRQRNVWDVESSSIAIFKPGLMVKFSLRDASLLLLLQSNIALSTSLKWNGVCLFITSQCRASSLAPLSVYAITNKLSPWLSLQSYERYTSLLFLWSFMESFDTSKYSDIWRRSGRSEVVE